jgi:hypothetical protein
MVQTIFRDASFVGNEAALIRVIGMTVMVIGWLYLFGGLSGGRRIVAASILDRWCSFPWSKIDLGPSPTAHIAVGAGAGSTSFHLKTRTQDSLFMSRPNMLPQGGSEVLLFYVNE